MKALILNSGLGHRMGDFTRTHPKCMTEISKNETILSRQLKMLFEAGIQDVIITTGYFEDVLIEYCENLNIPLNIQFVKNPVYDKTNYIYSIYCAREFLYDDILLLHGDLVFEYEVLNRVLSSLDSCVKVSSTLPLPDKDFKAVVRNKRVYSIGTEFFSEAVEAQAFYKINRDNWLKWLNKINEYCENGICNCYAEKAFNEISEICEIYACDVKDRLCTEIDSPEDLINVRKRLVEISDEQEII